MPESRLLPHLKSLLPITVLPRFKRRGAPANLNGTQKANCANNMRSNGQLRVKQTARKPRSNQLESSNLTSDGAQGLTSQDSPPQTPWSVSPDPRYQVTPQEQGCLFTQATNLECSSDTPRLHKRQNPPSDSFRPPSGPDSDSDSDTDVPLTQNSCKRRKQAAPETLDVASAGCDTEQINSRDSQGRLSPLTQMLSCGDDLDARIDATPGFRHRKSHIADSLTPVDIHLELGDSPDVIPATPDRDIASVKHVF